MKHLPIILALLLTACGPVEDELQDMLYIDPPAGVPGHYVSAEKAESWEAEYERVVSCSGLLYDDYWYLSVIVMDAFAFPSSACPSTCLGDFRPPNIIRMGWGAPKQVMAHEILHYLRWRAYGGADAAHAGREWDTCRAVGVVT